MSALQHGQSRRGAPYHREYMIWCSIVQRCTNPVCADYPAYGGRGVTLSPEWRASFPAFFADMGPVPPGMSSIDRIRNDEGYSKENCEWQTWKAQARNRRSTRFVTVCGRRSSLKEAVESFGAVGYRTVLARLNRGWDVERAVTEGVAR